MFAHMAVNAPAVAITVWRWNLVPSSRSPGRDCTSVEAAWNGNIQDTYAAHSTAPSRPGRAEAERDGTGPWAVAGPGDEEGMGSSFAAFSAAGWLTVAMKSLMLKVFGRVQPARP